MLVNWDNYPNVASGGVYVWAKALVEGLREYDFLVFSQLSNANANSRYNVSSNVKSVLEVPLFGTHRIEEFYRGDTAFIGKVGRSDQQILEVGFLPVFEQFLTCLTSDGWDPEAFTRAIMDMRAVIVGHDAKKFMEHRQTWEAFLSHLRRDPLYQSMSLQEALVAYGLLQRGVQILSVELPKVDLVHTSLAWWPALIAVVAKEEQGVPVVVTEHGVAYRELMLYFNSILHNEPSKIFWKVFSRNIVRAVYHAADLIAPVCAANAVWEKALGADPSKIRVVYNGVDTERFRPMEVRRPSGPTVVSVARVDAFKDTTTLLYAMSHVREKVKDARCILYGDSNNLSYSKRCLKVANELGLGDGFVFAGGTKEPEKAYNVGDVVVFSSITEGFPFSVIEAMACGKAVVATRVGGVVEALEGCGVMVRSRDPKSLAEGVVNVLTDQEFRRTLEVKALARARESFSSEAMLAAYRQIYEKLTDEASAYRWVPPAPQAREVFG
ncbi:MAG TPA: GT4 family glycosyltransferase PelF [Nitrososphaerales archaeon]|nr:GT4 family glycosyltransferase PelF [Nitrososphaerales archaeon]